jgi:hypothetical protein
LERNPATIEIKVTGCVLIFRIKFLRGVNSKWRELLSMMQDGDELRTFSTNNESWDNMAGRAGVSLVRNGETIYSIVTKMN